MAKIVTFGEIMMRLQPPAYQRLVQADSFSACFGGSEANTAAALAHWGEHAVFVSKIPANDLGEACIRSLRAFGVDTAHIARGNGRMGVYYTERGASQRPPQVLYDRKYSDFSLAEPEDFDFGTILQGAEWLHFSGITPAIGGRLPELMKTAIDAARREGCRISCDFNFRSKLWNADDARKTMTPLITGIDVLIINENQAHELFGIDTCSLDKAAAHLTDRFSLGMAVLTQRKTISGEVNEFAAMLYNDGKTFGSRNYEIFMIDKIGGGDAFSAGLIYCLINGISLQETVDFAAAAAVCKHTIEGDMLTATTSDIEWILRSDGKGRMVR